MRQPDTDLQMTECFDENVLLAFVEGSLPETDLASVAQHLEHCENCRLLLSAFDLTKTNSESEIPLKRIGRYIVDETIGSGSMGVVQAAHDPDLSRKVAIKLLHPNREMGGPERSRLLREAQAMAKLSHPSVVTVHDVGIEDGQLFLVMELVEGQTLLDWFRTEKRDPSEILDAFTAAGRGLAAAHEAKIVHRDFKPANVLVGSDGRVCVTDFGLARPIDRAAPSGSDLDLESVAHLLEIDPDESLTKTGMILGTPAYMAPEQLRGGRTDVRTDQFGFCVALFEALYGERPFPGGKLRQLVQNVVHKELPATPPDPAIPLAVHQVVLRGLSRQGEDRFPTMHMLLEALAEARRPAPVPVAPDPVPFAFVGILLLVALAAVVTVAFLLTQEKTEILLPATKPVEQEKPPAPKATKGALVVTSPDRVRIMLNSELITDGEEARIEVAADVPHRLSVSAPGRIPLERTVVVEAGQELALPIALEKVPAKKKEKKKRKKKKKKKRRNPTKEKKPTYDDGDGIIDPLETSEAK